MQYKKHLLDISQVFLTVSECNPFSEMTCNNGRCVTTDVKCDGVNNCGDYTDELKCGGMYYFLMPPEINKILTDRITYVD